MCITGRDKKKEWTIPMDDNVNYDQQGPCVLANESIIDCQVTSSQQVIHPPYTREVCTLRL